MPVDTQYTVSDGTFEVFPADVYDARLTDINRKTLPVTDQETGAVIQADFLEFEFTLLGGEYDGKIITDVAREYKSLGPKSKMRGWLEGMTGVSLTGRTEPVNPNKLIGRECRINVSRGPNLKGLDRNKVTSILPPRKAAPAPAPKVAPKPAADEGDLF